jgi:hypothetical protein
MRALPLALALVLVAGCFPPSLDLSNRRCPCTAGWTCDTATDRCVQGAVSDAFVADAGGSDAAHADAGDDASAPDTGGIDAFVPPIDAGVDAFVPVDAFSPIDAYSGDAGMPGDTGCGTTFAGALLCDGFETDPGPWTGRREVTGTVAPDGLQAFRGTRAQHARITAGSGQAARDFDGWGPITSGDLWIRIEAYVPSTSTPFDFTWLSIGENLPPYHGISLGMGGDGAVGSYSTISANYVSDSTLIIPEDAWVCLELHVAVSDTAGSIEIYRDGVLRASHAAIDTRPDAGFTGFGAGIDYSDAAQPPLETWLDEVVLSRTRFPCP